MHRARFNDAVLLDADGDAIEMNPTGPLSFKAKLQLAASRKCSFHLQCKSPLTVAVGLCRCAVAVRIAMA